MARTFKVEAHKGHFYASSIAEWRTGTDPEKIVKAMKTGGFNFSLIWVPLPPEAEYKIENYAPVVDGCILLATYKVV